MAFVLVLHSSSFLHFNNNKKKKIPSITIAPKHRTTAVRVLSKDLEPTATIINSSSSSSSAVKPTTKEDEEEEKKAADSSSSYYVNIGYAIRTLRQDLPHLFYKDPTFHIYRDDIVFKDPLNTFSGIDSYKSIFWALRFSGRLFFKALWVDIISVWQPVETTIMIRWTVHGIPRVPGDTRGRFDATSEYKLDKAGKIYQHCVHNIALNAPPKFQVLSVNELIQSLGCPSTPKPTYFETRE